ncbi:D-alanine--D-alanine ligase [Mesorhizobium sp. M0698]|uniref:D-alanine--D-alanine ligase family protein n=1 Tax=Mesorhizobium sp. M0698 TaxID=2956987 RepID=UPI00333B327A
MDDNMHDAAMLSAARQVLSNTRLLLLAGGSSTERGSSLTTRDALVPYLQKLCRSVEVVDPNDVDHLLRAARQCDFVLNVVYGAGGEDGTIQGFFDILRVPYSGPSTLPSAIGMNKEIFVSLLRDSGYPVPHGCLVTTLGDPRSWPRELQQARILVLKPIDEGDSLGIKMLDGQAAAAEAIARIEPADRSRWRLEEFIEGPFGTVGIFQGGPELIIGDAVLFDLPDGWRFYDDRLKLKLVDERATPRILHRPAAERIRNDALRLYRQLNCKGLVRFDFIYSDGAPVYLEANTIPGLYPGSNVAHSFQSRFSFEDLLTLTTAVQIPGQLK